MARDEPNGPWCPSGQLLSTTKKRLTFFYEVYISILVGCSSWPYYSTDKDNTNINELE